MSNSFIHKKVVIVGAGIAGISCARQLKKFGFEDVTLLEARDRVGGRMHTIMHKSNSLELGAQWIHGEVGNPIYELCRENDLIDTDAPNYMEAAVMFTNYEQSIRPILAKAFSILDESIESSVLNSKVSLEDSLKTAFDTKATSLMSSTCAEKYMKGLYRCYYNILCEINGCEKLSSVSASLLKKYMEYPGQHTVELKEGYRTVLNVLLDDIPDEWIQKNKNVSNINWSELTESKSTCQVKITCSDESCFDADHVIVTLPLGCLKEQSASVFVPPLPDRKLEAIRCLGYGTVNKVYLEFDCPFWEPADIFMLMQDFEREGKGEEEESLLYTCINRFAYVPHQPHMLCAWVTGKGALQMEKMAESDIIKDCLFLLKKTLNKSDLPQPSNIIVSKWFSDPFSYGSYSYLSMECEKLDVGPADLAEPIFTSHDDFKHPTLMFAGEATHSHCFSTVHGAYETGIREAIRLLSSYCSETMAPSST